LRGERQENPIGGSILKERGMDEDREKEKKGIDEDGVGTEH
jgi:hypothetical protein